MTTDSTAITTTFTVGRFTCTMAAPNPMPGAVLHMTVEWSPDMPDRMTASELRQYRRGRDAFISKLAERMGGNALVVEAA